MKKVLFLIIAGFHLTAQAARESHGVLKIDPGFVCQGQNFDVKLPLHGSL